jgi:hypothetical protein
VSQSSEFCRHNPSCCFSKSVYCCFCSYFVIDSVRKLLDTPSYSYNILSKHFLLAPSKPSAEILGHFSPLRNVAFATPMNTFFETNLGRYLCLHFVSKVRNQRLLFVCVCVCVCVCFGWLGFWVSRCDERNKAGNKLSGNVYQD